MSNLSPTTPAAEAPAPVPPPHDSGDVLLCWLLMLALHSSSFPGGLAPAVQCIWAHCCPLARALPKVGPDAPPDCREVERLGGIFYNKHGFPEH